MDEPRDDRSAPGGAGRVIERATEARPGLGSGGVALTLRVHSARLGALPGMLGPWNPDKEEPSNA